MFKLKKKQTISNPAVVPSVKYYEENVMILGNSYNVLAMDLLGPSLQDLFDHSHRVFSRKTISMLAIQMINALEFVHYHNIVHRLT